MKKKSLLDQPLVPVIEESEVEASKSSKNDNTKAKKDVRLKLKYRTASNDINYHAPLSYRHLRLLGWIFLAITQLGIVFKVAAKVDTASGFDYGLASSIIELISSFPFVLFLLANFGIILRNRNNFKYLFIFYGGMMLGLYVVANIVEMHYVYGTLHAINPLTTFQDAAMATGAILIHMGTTGYMFNLFIDLFLCVLTVYFVFYVPKTKYFEGKKIIIFRSFVIIPIAYEVISIVIKQNTLLGNINLPSYFFFLLTSKPPLTFAAFFIVTVILKVREYKFLKLFNYDYDLLEQNRLTNAHSLRTSITIAVVFLIISHIDIVVMLTYMVIEAVKMGDADDLAFELIYSRAQGLGFGSSSSLIIVAPIALLYSYTKVHKNKKIDSFIPLIGIALVIFTIVEGFYVTLRSTIFQYIGGYVLDSYNMEARIMKISPHLINIKNCIVSSMVER